MHLEHLQNVLQSIKEATLTANPDKCCVGRETIFIGFQVGQGEVHPVRDKVEAISKIKRPPKVKRKSRD